jgi:hypothetical protein
MHETLVGLEALVALVALAHRQQHLQMLVMISAATSGPFSAAAGHGRGKNAIGLFYGLWTCWCWHHWVA